MEGTLAQFSVTELLRDLHASGDSGVLSVENEGTTKRLYFKQGDIVFASSTATEERLGERLVRAGKLKRSDLDLACRVRETSPLRLGTTLVDMGYLSHSELESRVREQVESIVHSILPWESGRFTKELTKDPIDPDLERSDLSTMNLLLDGIRRIHNAGTIRRGIGNLTGPLRYAVDPASLDHDLRLTPEEGFVLSRVDGVASAGQLAELSPMGEDETLRCIYALVVAGVLEVEPTEAPSPSPAGAEKREPEPEPAQKPVEARPQELSPEARKFRDEMVEKKRRAADITLYELLDVRPGAKPEEIKTAYFQLAKKLHPDHRAGLDLDDAEGLFDDLYHEIKAAYEVLSSETKRRRYDFNLQRRAEAPRADLRRERDTETTESEGDDSSSTRRSFSSKQMARIHVTNGERYFAEGRYHEAIEELRAAIRHESGKASYHRLLARALAKNPKWRKQAEEHYRKALSMNRFDAQSYVELGELYESSGLATRARKMFEEAIALDPDNLRAAEKLTGGGAGASTLGKIREILHRDRES